MSRVFVTSVWGFEPHRWAGQGFGHEGIRDKLIREYNSDDYLLLVATFGPEANDTEKGMLLGLAKLGSKALPTQQVVDPEMYLETRFQNNGRIKWPYSVPFTQAWHFDEPLKSRRELLPRLQDDGLGMKIGTGFEQLSDEEAAAVLRLPKTETPSLYKSDEMLAQEALQQSVGQQRKASKGPTPSFGQSLLQIEDSPASVYQLEFIGDVSAALGCQRHEIAGKKLFKLGWSIDPVNRARVINSYMPNSKAFGWKYSRSHRYDSRLKAYAVEQMLLGALSQYRHIGEMVLCAEKTLDAAWNAAVYAKPSTEGLMAGYQQSMLDRF